MKSPNLRIALLGTRGIPARYGGFETFAEELSVRLVDRGHKVTVFGRRRFFSASRAPEPYKGIERYESPTIMHKYLETPLHALTSFLCLLFMQYDVVLLCNAANSPFAWLARLKGIPLLINVDGIERRRTKWNMFGKLWYRLGELCSVAFATRIISDAHVIEKYYLRTYGAGCDVITYGASAIAMEAGALLQKYGLEPGKYLLYVSRLEPENNALGVIEAYCQAGTSMPLVIVGDAPYAKEYIEKLKRSSNSRVVFTGFQFGANYRELRNHCYLYIQATQVGGTHPALVEAMAYGNCIVANATPEHFEVLGGTGMYYWRNDFVHLAQCLRELVGKPEMVRDYGQAAKQRAEQRYRWEHITDSYEELLRRYALR